MARHLKYALSVTQATWAEVYCLHSPVPRESDGGPSSKALLPALFGRESSELLGQCRDRHGPAVY